MTNSLEGKYALVTGANSGVGQGIALELARAGFNVVVNYLEDCKAAEQTVSQIESLGVKSWSIQADVGSSAEVTRMFNEIRELAPRLDLLVNNAGVQTFACLLDLSEADWDRDIRTNLKGCFLCTQAAARWMKDAEEWLHHQHRLRLQQASIPASCVIYRQQRRHRAVHQSGGGGTG